MTNILVVDDDTNVLRILRRVLTKEGYNVFTAVDGEEALRKVEELRPDILITDLLMPNKEGIELMQEAKDLSPGIKLVVLSGGGQLQPGPYLELASGLGADHVFSKPVPMSLLVEAINNLVK